MDSPQSQQQEIMYSNNAVSSSIRELVAGSDSASVHHEKQRLQDFRAWLFFLTTLVATVSYTAGLTPPGGFWSTDDKAKGYVAGTSVMRAMFPRRYQAFYYSNATAFFSSLMIIGLLGTRIPLKAPVYLLQFKALVGICFVSVGISFISGTWENITQGIYGVLLFVVVSLYFSFLTFAYLKAGRIQKDKYDLERGVIPIQKPFAGDLQTFS